MVKDIIRLGNATTLGGVVLEVVFPNRPQREVDCGSWSPSQLPTMQGCLPYSRGQQYLYSR